MSAHVRMYVLIAQPKNLVRAEMSDSNDSLDSLNTQSYLEIAHSQYYVSV